MATNNEYFTRVLAFNHNKGQEETLTFYGTTQQQANERCEDWKSKRGVHYTIKQVNYGKTYDNTGA